MPAKKKSPKAQQSNIRHTIVTLRSEPAAIAQLMNVDRVMEIIAQAESGHTRDLFTLYRDVLLSDSHLQTEFAKRKLAVLGDAMNVTPWDKTSSSDMDAAATVETMIHECRSWKAACIHLLDSTLWPVAVVEKVYASAAGEQPQGGGHRLAYRLVDLVPVPHYLLDYSTGVMRISDVDPATGSILSTTREVDPERYIVHRGHLLSAPDNWGGPMRSIIFWWLLSHMDREWWARFLDRYGSPFLVGKYNKGDDASRNVLRNAFSLAVKLGGIVVTDDTTIELQQAAAGASGDAYEKFLAICQREKSKLILGQTLSAESQPTGLGSGVAGLQGAVRNDIRAWDAASLADTLRTQLFAQYLSINNLAAATPSLTWGAESAEDLKGISDLLVALKQAGIRATDDAIATLSERTGIQLERDPVAPSQPGFAPFAASALRTLAAGDQHIRDASADLVPLLREFPADVARVIRESATPTECQTRIETLYATRDRRRTATILADAMAVHAALAATRR